MSNPVQLLDITSFGNRGSIPDFCVIQDIGTLQRVVKEMPSFFVIGKGSNTVINPATKIASFIHISPDILPMRLDGGYLYANAGIRVQQLMRFCQRHGVSGLEYSAGVPASVGGMVYMNFGCWGKEVADSLEKVRIIDHYGKDRWIHKQDLKFGYRWSSFHDIKCVILEACFRMEITSPEIVKTRIQQAVQQRIEKQPLKEATFGSIFKNPNPLKAAKIIQDLGFKGRAFKGMKISEKHANFLVNMGEANFDALVEFLEKIQQEARLKFNVHLELEVQLVR